MLEITGKCCNGLDAIEFMESLADIFDEEVKTHEFCEQYEASLNRLRYEVSKSIAVPIKQQKRIHGKGVIISCGKCGWVGVEEPSHKYCANCGTAIKR